MNLPITARVRCKDFVTLLMMKHRNKSTVRRLIEDADIFEFERSYCLAVCLPEFPMEIFSETEAEEMAVPF